jgi:putative chitinase
VHLTGKSNYIAASKNLGKDFVNNPDDVLLPENLMLVAADYWKSNKLNALADAWDIAAISKKVNGGTLGLKERIQLSNWALEAYTGLEKIKT